MFILMYAGQASICLIDQNVDALNVEIQNDCIILHACILRPSVDTEASLAQIRNYLEETLRLFVSPVPKVLLKVAYGINDDDWDGWSHMSIYKAHWRTRE